MCVGEHACVCVCVSVSVCACVFYCVSECVLVLCDNRTNRDNRI